MTAGSASAATLVDQSNTGTFDNGISFVTAANSQTRYVGQSFVAGVTGSLSSIEAALYRQTDFESGVVATFYNSSLNLLGTTSVASLPSGAAAFPAFGASPIYSLFDFASSNISIEIGSLYFFAFRSTGLKPINQGGNFTNALASSGNKYTQGNAFQSFGSVMPTQTVYSDLDLLFRSNVTTADVTAAVPEPATWALFLLGFGAIGYSMRRRNRTVTKASFA